MVHCVRRLLLSMCAALCAAGLSSCLELYSEEMTIHEDLSGEAKVEVTLPDTLIEKFSKVHDEFSPQNIEKRFAGLKGVKLRRYTLAEGRKPKATFEVSFSSLEKLNEAIAANEPASVLAGAFSVTKAADGKRTVERKLGTGTPKMDLPDDSYANYKVHFDTPVEVVGTNSEYYDQPHNDMRYRWPMARIVTIQPVLAATVVRPFPWMWILIAVLALLLVTWFGWLSFGSIRRNLDVKAKARAKALADAEAAAPQEGAPQTQGPRTPQRPGPPRRPGPPGR
jgi:hypothetical protein